MLWRLRTVALALIAVVAMAARPAAAAVVTATYSGTVASGFDFLGVFGTPGRDLSGKAYSARYVFDDRTPGLSRQTSSSLTYLFGYNRTGSPPFMASTLLIDGVQTVLTSPGSGAAYTLFNDPRDQIDHSFVSNFFDSGAFIDTWSMIFDVRSNVGFLPDKS